MSERPDFDEPLPDDIEDDEDDIEYIEGGRRFASRCRKRYLSKNQTACGRFFYAVKNP
ncbi:hypothetical protein [Mixta calida]|uniref:hypothetical protein n=1 Tax=Mixta calida TaxID=665913 RepID=UPI0028A72105|nr:hypothetical protein [Mixta calida]